MRKASFVALGWLALVGSGAAEEPGLPSTAADAAKLTVAYEDKGHFFEGPTWDPKTGKLYFTDFAKETRVMRLDGAAKATAWMEKTAGVNGTYLSKDGRLLGAQAFGHQVISYAFGQERAYDPQVLHADGKLHQPNDLCEAPNSNIYFTDPDFDKRMTSAVWLLKPDGKASKVVTDMPVPNGIKTSPDGKTLYVSDSHLKLWRSYPIKADGSVGEGKVFFNPDNKDTREPDGMCVDEEGNLYFSGRGGVWVVTPDGKALGLIPIKEFCSNCTFGGADGKTLYMTCQDKVYSLQMKVRGVLFKK